MRASPRQQVASPPASSGTSLPECHNCARTCGESPKPSGVQRTHTRVPAPQLELFIYFEGRSISDPGIGELRGCSLSLLPGRVHPGVPLAFLGRPSWGLSQGRATLLPAGPYIKVSDSSPPIGQFSKSAFKFPWCWVGFFSSPEGEGKRSFCCSNSFPCM